MISQLLVLCASKKPAGAKAPKIAVSYAALKGRSSTFATGAYHVAIVRYLGPVTAIVRSLPCETATPSPSRLESGK